MSCNPRPIPEPPEWVGCDGKLLSDELIEAQMKRAVAEDRYEHAAKCLKELVRRGIGRQKLELLKLKKRKK